MWNNKPAAITSFIQPVLWDCWSKIGLNTFEKELSALVTVTGRVANNTHAVTPSGTWWELIMTFCVSNAVLFSSSLLNSRLKDRTSVTKFGPSLHGPMNMFAALDSLLIQNMYRILQQRLWAKKS